MLDFKKKKIYIYIYTHIYIHIYVYIYIYIKNKQKKLKGGVLLDRDRLSNKELSRCHFIKTER
jgi:hypothetical protein